MPRAVAVVTELLEATDPDAEPHLATPHQCRSVELFSRGNPS